MREVSVRGALVSVTHDPHRVLTQLISCILEHPSPRTLEPRFAPGGEGFVLDRVVEARPTSPSDEPYRSAAQAAPVERNSFAPAKESWTVTMHRAKKAPCIVVLDGTELRQLVHNALFASSSAVGRQNRREATLTFGIGGATFIACTLVAHQYIDWFGAVPFGVFMGLVVGIRVARMFIR